MRLLQAAFRSKLPAVGFGTHVFAGVVALILVPAFGGLLGLPAWILRSTTGAVEATWMIGFLERIEAVGMLLVASPMLAWMGIVPLVLMAPVLSRFGWAGWASFAALGIGIGIAVGIVHETTVSRGASLRPDAFWLAILAASGMLYALSYRLLMTPLNTPRGSHGSLPSGH